MIRSDRYGHPTPDSQRPLPRRTPDGEEPTRAHDETLARAERRAVPTPGAARPDGDDGGHDAPAHA